MPDVYKQILNFLTKPEAGMPVALFTLPPKLSHVVVVIAPVGQRGRNAGEEQKRCRRNEQSGAHGRTSFYKEPLLRINAAPGALFRGLGTDQPDKVPPPVLLAPGLNARFQQR